MADPKAQCTKYELLIDYVYLMRLNTQHIYTYMCVQCTYLKLVQTVCRLSVLSVHCIKSQNERNPSLVERKTFNRKMKPYLLRTQREIQNMYANCNL